MFDATTCQNISGASLVDSHNGPSCDIALPAGDVDGRPVGFVQGGRIIGSQSSGDGSGKLTIAPDFRGDISVLVSSAGP